MTQSTQSKPASKRSKSGSSNSAARLKKSRGSKNSPAEVEVLDMMMRVTTPENISFQYRLVGPFRRVFAYALDILISVFGYGMIVLLFYLLFLFLIVPLARLMGGTATINALGGVFTGLILTGYFIVYWFYGAYMETYFNGQTFGKRALRMRVISNNGHAIDGVQATLRNFFRLLDIMPMVPLSAMIPSESPVPGQIPTCLFGLVIMAINTRYQRVGDLVAGTVVVNEERNRLPTLATFSDERVPALAELIPANFVVPASMARAVADYADQRRYLPFQRASEVASHLASPLIERFELPSDTDHDLFLCALYYKTYVATLGRDEDDSQPSVALPAEASQNENPFLNAPEETFSPEEFEFPTDGDTK